MSISLCSHPLDLCSVASELPRIEFLSPHCHLVTALVLLGIISTLLIALPDCSF
jgi:hypothetical protein